MPKSPVVLLCVSIFGFVGPGLAPVVDAVAQTTTTGFTPAQAEQGAAIYRDSCAGCHGANLQGSPATALSGAAFLSRWRTGTVAELASVIHRTMPPDRPGSLSEAAVLALTAYILQSNGASAGTRALGNAEQAPVGQVLSAASPAARAPGEINDLTPATPPPPPSPSQIPLTPHAEARLAAMRAPLERLRPVSDEMQRNPPAGDWLHWRRTYDGWAFSPLNQITRDNVKNLKVAWTSSMASPSDAVNEITPLVHDGIMFLWNFGETIQALDAKTGTVLWQYVHDLPKDYPQLPGFYRTKRSLGIGGNKLIVPTIDMRIVALDITTGKKIWDVSTDDYKSERTYNSGPLIVKDKVIVGAGNCSPGSANSRAGAYFPRGGCFITGHDLETGKELWRFNTVARASEPGGDTWNDLPDEMRGGSAIWVAGQYDPDLNLTFWGTGSPSPWSTVTRGTFGAMGLYMNSTLALDPDNGKLVWHYQHIGADPYDQDYAFEHIVAPVTLRGRRHKAVITVGKAGVFEALDAATGKFLFAADPGAQNVITSIDPVTGARTFLPEPLPAGVTRCPGNIGARNFPAGAYSPSTNLYYLPITDTCMKRMGETPARFLALDLNTQKFVWDVRSRLPQSSGVLTTAGGLVFSATPDGYFRAFDDRDGKVLWESPRLNDIPNAFPISYSVDGKQYVAMPVGNTGLQGRSALNTAPEYRAMPRGASSSVLWVWELP
ncbi:MAG: PQQ-binding-like beta-propeller repeat protein [Gemmatimonadetes bacterium]|nr:PQQ-binding-like beta-propeller repeat protein [Gemmatimonadota bacterium]